jgi:hypothetical protein
VVGRPLQACYRILSDPIVVGPLGARGDAPAGGPIPRAPTEHDTLVDATSIRRDATEVAIPENVRRCNAISTAATAAS